MQSKVVVSETECSSIISDSGLYGVDYSINPYVGCQHSCKYCYATFMKRFSEHEESWGKFVDVKVNARQVLVDDLMKKDKGSVLISSVTDPYQPIEEEYELTRKILERLANTKFSVNILTKSDLVTRDIDILKEFQSDRISVGFTINYLSERDRDIWEPGAPEISERVSALKEVSETGIDTYVHVGPYFPNITNLDAILEEVGEYINEFQVENLNFKENEKKIIETIKLDYPDSLKLYNNLKREDYEHRRNLKRIVDRLNSNVPINLFLD